MKPPPKNVAASVRQRLLNLSRARREDFQALLTRYAIERLLYRLGSSSHGREFVLKGAALFAVWSGEPHRATKDLDLLGRGSIDISRIETVFRAVCGAPVPDDGLIFDATSVRGERIREGMEYEGVRIEFTGRLDVARIKMQVDVAFGDAVTPRPAMMDYPALLDFPHARLRVYPRETVVAEKFQAMVTLGMTNSRMKDFFDVWSLASAFEFRGEPLAKALAATFERRKTDVPREAPLALSDTFSGNPEKQKQWTAFVRRGQLAREAPSLARVVESLADFLMPPSRAAAERRKFRARWRIGSGWRALRA